MNYPFPLLVTAILLSGTLSSTQADPLADLRSPDMAVRRQAIEQVQTLDDPRIPAACLPLLNDPGLSIRRLAARAIGSRFEQITEADRPRYLTALQACLDRRQHEPVVSTYQGPDDITLMCQRAIGLLTRRYDSAPFSVSPNGRWVLYERRRLPVVADITKQQHFLLAPVNPRGSLPDIAYYSEEEDETKTPDTNLLKTVDTNLPVKELFAPHWRPDGEAVAFTLERLEQRFYHPILVWSAATPDHVQVLDEAFFQSLLGDRYPHWGTTTDFAGWKGNRVRVRVYDCATPEGNPASDPGVVVSYDVATGKQALER